MIKNISGDLTHCSHKSYRSLHITRCLSLSMCDAAASITWRSSSSWRTCRRPCRYRKWLRTSPSTGPTSRRHAGNTPARSCIQGRQPSLTLHWQFNTLNTQLCLFSKVGKITSNLRKHEAMIVYLYFFQFYVAEKKTMG